MSEDKKVADKKVADKKVADKKVADKKVADKEVVDKKVADKKVVDKKVADKKVVDKKVADKKVADKSIQSVLSPHVTEKATMVADKLNQVIFKVRKDATKMQVKEAIETMFKVDVKAVNLLNVKGKTKRASRNSMGKRADWKKAYVSVQTGQEINFTGE
jgi:large subunit ribosomal protein L23